MIITAAADNSNIDSPIAKRFGHAEYYLVYNTDNEEFEAIYNTDHDHTHSILNTLIEKGTKVFIVGNVGPHAFEIINTNNTSVYLARKMTVSEAIAKYSDGELRKLDEPTVKKSINHSH